MNIRQLHDTQKEVSAKPLFKTAEGNVNALLIAANGLLKEHVTQVPALLLCVSGEVIFENETGLKQTLSSGDFIHIEPLIKHWVRGVTDSHLLLVK